jgi:hypothetical protein
MGLWGIALYVDDYPGLAQPSADLQIPTWNFRSIYAGLNGDPTWASRFTTAYPITPTTLSFGSFNAQRPGLRGGANAYFEISGSAATAQVLSVRALGGGNTPASIRIAIARLQ